MLEDDLSTPAPQASSQASSDPTPATQSTSRFKQVMVLQGGGALGSYQAGVLQGLCEAHVQPDWVTGISIGAINAALIVGNAPEDRVAKLRAFWEQTSSGPFFSPLVDFTPYRTWLNQISAATIATVGAPGFFSPRAPGPAFWPSDTPEAISYYDTRPLRETLERLVDFGRINHGPIRLSVGAVDVESGNSVVFDSAEQTIGPEHIMASGALPPGFPPVWIEGRAYWDGGLVSNTPLQFVLDAEREEDLLIFQVDLFNARGPIPSTIFDVDEREKDIRYSSRTRMNTDQSLRIHKVKTALRALLKSLPKEHAEAPQWAVLRDAAKENAVTIVQLIYRKRPYEGGSKDYEFSRQTMLEHWASGAADVKHTLARHPDLFDPPSAAGMRVIDAGRAGDEPAIPSI